jgi:hypothetical protein
MIGEKRKRLLGYTLLMLALLALAFVSYRYGWLSTGSAIFAVTFWPSAVITWAILQDVEIEERKR